LGDLLSLPLAALWQQKSRTVLTTLGVVFGTFVLAASLSIGQGVQDTFDRETHKSDVLREIRIQPQFGDSKGSASKAEVKGTMNEARRERLRDAIGAHRRNVAAAAPIPLSRERLAELARLPHVEAVVPQTWQGGQAVLGQKSQSTAISAARLNDLTAGEHLVEGRFFESPDEPSVVVSEYLLYRLGVVDDDAVKGVVGKKLTVEFRAHAGPPGLSLDLSKSDGEEPSRDEIAALDKVKQALPAVLAQLKLSPGQLQTLQKALSGAPQKAAPNLTREFTIVGVMRGRTTEEQQVWDPLHVDGDLILPYGTATDLFTSSGEMQVVNMATLLVDRDSNVESVLAEIHNLNLPAFAFLEGIKHERLMYLLIFAGMTCVAAVALLVAAMGIANTMLMSVLERMREIGIMKAVGASNGQLQLVFLVEGALIGLVGGGFGLTLAVLSSYPGDAWVRTMVNRDIKIELKEALFVFPAWLCLTVLAFAVVITTLAAVYPARRAAMVDPVTALRHE
jgi:putative ABC transport system permease protein